MDESSKEQSIFDPQVANAIKASKPPSVNMVTSQVSPMGVDDDDNPRVMKVFSTDQPVNLSEGAKTTRMTFFGKFADVVKMLKEASMRLTKESDQKPESEPINSR